VGRPGAPGRPLPLNGPADSASAYSGGAQAWEEGPARLVYDRLAEILVAFSPCALGGGSVLDLGAGSGAASRAARAAGARVVAADPAPGMLLLHRERRPPAVVADARAMPFREAAFDVVVAAFSLNHLPDPRPALLEVRRVLGAGGTLLASAYAEDDDHPVKAVVDDALSREGWSAPAWYPEIRRATKAWATAERAAGVVERAGLPVLVTEQRRVCFPMLSPADLVRWRLGMAQAAWFVDALDARRRRTLVRHCAAAIKGAPPLERSIVLLAAGTGRADQASRLSTQAASASP